MRYAFAACVLLSSACMPGARAQTPGDTAVAPFIESAQVASDADDPAIWINREDPARSLIIGTNKVAAPDGGLYVFGMDGQIRQVIKPLDRPNNVDVEYGLPSAGGPLDIAVATERLQHRLRVFQVRAAGLVPLDGGRGIPILEGTTGDASEPMGIALYKRPRDGAIFAIVAPKSGGTTDYLWQYRLEVDSATGLMRGRFVRRFGAYSGTGEIEAVAVDDALGHVYYSDEEFGVRKWHADPDHPDAGRELAVFGRTGFKQQREGIGIVSRADGTGYIVVSDQINNATELRVYPRAVTGQARPHEPLIAAIRTRADSTDGLEIVTSGLSGEFADGLLVMMSSRARNFQLYRWRDVEQRLPRTTRNTGS